MSDTDDTSVVNLADFCTAKRIREANEASDASKWLPRDALVETLARLDAGEINPDTLAVVYLEILEDDRGIRDHFVLAAKGRPLDVTLKVSFLAEAFKNSVARNG